MHVHVKGGEGMLRRLIKKWDVLVSVKKYTISWTLKKTQRLNALYPNENEYTYI